PDDRARLFDELPPKVIRRMLSQLNAEELQSTSLLLGYRADTAGRIMTPEYISVKDSLTVAQAQQKIRDLAAKVEVSYYVYVTDAAKRLIGTVSLRDLVLADPEQTLAEVMTQDIVYAYTDTDQEEVAQMIQRYDLLALPIVDREHNLLGAVTVDDTLDILQQETTEDIYTMGAVQAEGSNYFQSSLLGTARKRLPWLLILLLTNAATVLILKHHEAVLTQVITLTFFAPMLIDAGGNVGAQSATVVIRGLSTDELRNKKPLTIVMQELLAGSLLGTLLGGLVMLVVLLWMGLGEIAVIMGISLLAICAIAAAAGAALPYLCKTLGFDPALMSAPFITTIVDVVGILIYLNTAKLLLGI
ncbi:MAG TPA: magnesium transporter, partial [Allocoleopsis sp.]